MVMGVLLRFVRFSTLVTGEKIYIYREA